ncbi:hypothetical protein COL5a_002674 [Colletotrichum fioriniae]|uniref:uncharacterized protein n=1 Tax=Colletotrichum fioriniae TaxID=710243 RepID=UPI0023018499|nr:uncharacterized protein COL516b_004979 [Colletotrichum fioriniae]KAJ0305871.1 hypothetical protein COL516b_004979 [Colletotrichum fioriniae]KAJ0331141.1 hypothetical protein COL5a_002674 [Colletotrichum fioriniae]KAJ3950265.1 hypothetical protein N0V96_001409 [Colletotrichum fioriniae]
MVNKYNITVQNQSGSQQQYVLFSKPPKVTGRVQGQIWSNIFATGNTPRGSRTIFSVLSQYYAIVATSQGSPSMGVEVDVSSERDVILGSLKDDGTAVPGTTLQLIVDEDAPQFSDSPLPNSASPNAFEIQTGNDFTVALAKQGNYLIGLGGSRTGDGQDGPLATFIPEPSVRYQIQPLNTYYLTVGSYRKGEIIDASKIGGSIVAIDFTKLRSNNVVIVHDDHGNLNIQAQ